MITLKGGKREPSLLLYGEGHGIGEEPENTAEKNSPVYGVRDVMKAGDGTGEISSGR